MFRYTIQYNTPSEHASGSVHLYENRVIFLFDLMNIYKTTIIGKSLDFMENGSSKFCG